MRMRHSRITEMFRQKKQTADVFSFRMEVKVFVEGVQRIVCGVTEKTTCQEVVIALAQALGK